MTEIPKALKNIFDIIYPDFDQSTVDQITKLTEKDVTRMHHTYGRYIRNNLYLWWHENHGYEGWPKEKPEIVAWFNTIGIFHADDMSSIILLSFIRTIRGEDIKLEEQLKLFFDHWKREGFEDGIYKIGN